MKITRKTTMTVKTSIQSSEHRSSESENIFCQQSAEPTISAPMPADVIETRQPDNLPTKQFGQDNFIETEK